MAEIILLFLIIITIIGFGVIVAIVFSVAYTTVKIIMSIKRTEK